MNLERFTLIVESYGADPQQWPGDERVEALAFSRTSTEAMSILDQEIALDQHLALFELPDNKPLVQRIVQRIVRRIVRQIAQQIAQRTERSILFELKPGRMEQFLNWVLPDFDDLAHTVWRPTLAACMPLLLGVVIGLYDSNTDELSSDELSSDEALSLLAFTDMGSEDWSDE